jgi:sulfatase modifying factor 1
MTHPGRSVEETALAGLSLVQIPGGAFAMGSLKGRPDEAPVHLVDLRSFLLARTPLTRSQYAPFLAEVNAEAPPWWSDPAFAKPDQPVVGVTWLDAVAYTEWLSDRLGGLYRLPTEAEWERAARGGLPSAETSWGREMPPGEIPVGSLSGPWPVGRGRPNGYGLFDIGTIVHEWCSDWYRADYYAVSPSLDPHGPEEGERKASRGGSWRHHVRFSPPSARSSLLPNLKYADYGFRVAATIPSP